MGRKLLIGAILLYWASQFGEEARAYNQPASNHEDCNTKNASMAPSSALSSALLLQDFCLDQETSCWPSPAGGQILADDPNDKPSRAINWIHRYVDEQAPGAPLAVADHTIDQRFGNIVHLANIVRMFTFFSQKFNSPLASVSNRQLEQLAAGPNVNDTLCSEQLAEMLHQMGEMQQILEQRRRAAEQPEGGVPLPRLDERHLRLARLLDSYGHYEAGLLAGHTYSVGAYSVCLDSQLLLAGQLVGSRYCMANLDVTEHQDKSLRQPESDDYFTLAVCLPESCHTRSFHENRQLIQALVDSQFQLPASMFQERHLQVKSLFCEIDALSPLAEVPPSGKLLMLFAAVWLAAILYSTYRCAESSTLKHDNPASAKLMQCLDLRRSWDEFTGSDKQSPAISAPRRVQLDTLNLVKVLGSLLVVMGHTILIRPNISMDVIRLTRQLQDDYKIFFFIGITVIVDSFYVITGIIISYSTMKRFEASKRDSQASKKQEVGGETSAGSDGNPRGLVARGRQFLRQCMGFIMLRYLRLIPLYFLVFWFKKSLMSNLSSGPFWDRGYNRETESGACREESWLTPFTFGAAYLPLTKQCLATSWSVAGDLFFSFLVAPIVMLMLTRPKLAGLVALALTMASNWAQMQAFSSVNSDMLQGVIEMEFVSLSPFFRDHSYVYTAPHLRVSSILVGVLAGYVLIHYGKATSTKGEGECHEKGTSKLNRWPQWFSGPATRLSIYYILFALLALPSIPIFKNNLYAVIPMHKVLLPLMSTTNRLFWSVANAIIFLRMTTDWSASYAMRQAAGQFWSTLSKLSFSILLVHLELLKADAFIQLSSDYFSYPSALRSFAAIYFACLLLGTILYVAFENPVDKLVKTFISSKP